MGERGLSSSVQVALLLPVAFTVLLGLLQWSFLLWAEAEARGIASNTAWDAASIGGRYEKAGNTAALRDVSVDVERGEQVTVAIVSGHALRLLPGIDLTVRQRAEVPSERVD